MIFGKDSIVMRSPIRMAQPWCSLTTLKVIINASPRTGLQQAEAQIAVYMEF